MKKIILLIGFVTTVTVYTQEKIDYRAFQTPVKNQGNRGTCTAFGVAAAIEVLPGVPADLSEQYLYGALKYTKKAKTYNEGGFLKDYLNSIRKYGLIHEENLAYVPKNIDTLEGDSQFIKFIKGTHIGQISLYQLKNKSKYTIDNQKQYSYFSNPSMEIASNPQIVKQLLQNGSKAVAVFYNLIHTSTWSRTSIAKTKMITLDNMVRVTINGIQYKYSIAKTIYDGNILEAYFDKKIQLYLNANEDYGGHIVTIVGYDDRGFILKNSWGTTWGEQGYTHISYDAHKLMCREVLAFHSVTFNKTKLNNNVKPDIRLKTTLVGNVKKSGLSLSVFTTNVLDDPMYSAVKYTIYDSNYKLIGSIHKLAKIGAKYDNSFKINIREKILLPITVLTRIEPMIIVLEITFTNNTTKKYTYTNVYHKTNEYRTSKVY